MRRSMITLAFGLMLSLAGTAMSATYTVNKVADSNDGSCDADCSLREAVAAAAASGDDDQIVFEEMVFGVSRTIVLSGSEIVVTGNGSLTIQGPGADLLTVDGNGASRILMNAAGAVTTISDIAFTGGNGVGPANSGRGGAIYNNGGTLRLERLVLADNSGSNGGALNNASSGALALVDCLVSGNTATTSSGGGLQNFSGSTLTITGSTFVGNVSNGTTGGGGAQLNGTTTIANSTFSGNGAPNGSGGGISANGPSLLIVNSTFTQNSAGNNAGGLHRATTNTSIFLRNNIFAGNTGPGASPDVTASASVSSLGNNLVGSAGTTMGWVGSDLLNQDPLLGALADHGGPTPTHALAESSPAVDAGHDCVLDQTCSSNNLAFDLDTDQRGEPRPSGPAVDIGAYEISDVIFANGFQ